MLESLGRSNHIMPEIPQNPENVENTVEPLVPQ
jgi:hypothetical protein